MLINPRVQRHSPEYIGSKEWANGSSAMNYERRIGYYELFNMHERSCDKVYPEDLEVASLTHVNLAFVNFDSSFKMIDTDGDLISRVTFLKSRYQGLRVNVAIGGWAFNDPPTQTLFSDSMILLQKLLSLD